MIIWEYNTWVDFIVLSMVDFDIILRIYGLSSIHTVLDWFPKIVTFDMLYIPLVLRQGSFSRVLMDIISYMLARRLISVDWGWFLSYFLYISDVSSFINSIIIVNDFIDVFLTDLPSLFPKKDTEFSVNLDMTHDLFLWFLIMFLLSR